MASIGSSSYFSLFFRFSKSISGSCCATEGARNRLVKEKVNHLVASPGDGVAATTLRVSVSDVNRWRSLAAHSLGKRLDIEVCKAKVELARYQGGDVTLVLYNILDCIVSSTRGYSTQLNWLKQQPEINALSDDELRVVATKAVDNACYSFFRPDYVIDLDIEQPTYNNVFCSLLLRTAHAGAIYDKVFEKEKLSEFDYNQLSWQLWQQYGFSPSESQRDSLIEQEEQQRAQALVAKLYMAINTEVAEKIRYTIQDTTQRSIFSIDHRETCVQYAFDFGSRIALEELLPNDILSGNIEYNFLLDQERRFDGDFESRRKQDLLPKPISEAHKDLYKSTNRGGMNASQSHHFFQRRYVKSLHYVRYFMQNRVTWQNRTAAKRQLKIMIENLGKRRHITAWQVGCKDWEQLGRLRHSLIHTRSITPLDGAVYKPEFEQWQALGGTIPHTFYTTIGGKSIPMTTIQRVTHKQDIRFNRDAVALDHLGQDYMPAVEDYIHDKIVDLMIERSPKDAPLCIADIHWLLAHEQRFERGTAAVAAVVTEFLWEHCSLPLFPLPEGVNLDVKALFAERVVYERQYPFLRGIRNPKAIHDYILSLFLGKERVV